MFDCVNVICETSGLEIHPRSRWVLFQIDVTLDTALDDLQAVRPEGLRADINPKAGSQICGAPLTCGGQQFLVLGDKFGTSFLVNRVQPDPKE